MPSSRRAPRDTHKFDPPPAGTPLKLLIVSPQGSTTHPLPASGAVVIGRDESCTIAIDDLRISRRHVQINVGAVLSVRDLGSANGTTLAGVRLQADEDAELSPGAVLTLGSATVVVQSGSPTGRLHHLRSHAYFEARLEDECARVGVAGGTFTVGRVRCGPKDCLAVEAALAALLRPMDVVAAYAPNHYELLLVDMPPEIATALLDRLAEKVPSNDVETSAVTFPAQATTPEELLTLRARHSADGKAASDEVVASGVYGGAMDRLQPLVERVASSAITVIILGETGVGKEVLATRIHALSTRAKRPFVGINCAAIAESLLESELFGHERGAFTGAVTAKAGILESANGGTVFLDEVAEMPLPVQAKLLRVLENREVTRVGSVRAIAIDVRIVAATNRDLEDEVRRGRFREDLYFRLNGITIVVPPLRERVQEIEPLARSFLVRFAKENGSRMVPRLSGEVLGLLHRYAWPGNIRELRNAMERAAVLCTGDTILLDHLPHEKMGRVLAPTRATLPPPAASPSRIRSPEPRSARTKDHRLIDPEDERRRILRALESCGGNQTEAAKLLGMSRRTLLNRLAEYRLARPRKPAQR
jgi:DNA-binding NtrC family response regulator